MDESVEQIDPTANITPETVKKRVVSGAAILTLRTFFIQAISFFANALLTVFLGPADYGIFFLVSAVVNFLAYFGDVGFAAALIQKKDQLTKEDLRTVFTIQQTLVLLILAIVIVLTPFVQKLYHLNQQGVYLLWALAFSLFLSSLKTIPTVLLERKLEFNKWIVPQIIETILFNVTTVYFAWKGYGINSFTYGVLIRGVAGLVLTYLIQPWMPGIQFSIKSLKQLMKFGIPYQGNILLAMIKDDGMTLFLGGILGPAGVGLLGWAQKWAYAPLRFFMDQVIKVTFPAFSRLQDNKEELSKAVTKSIFFICLLVFPSLVGLSLVAPSLVLIIPKYIKWSPALFALSAISVTSALAAVTTPLTNTLSAIGKIGMTFKFMIMWTILTWVLVPILAISYGVSGAAVGFALVGLSSLIAIYLASKYIEVNYLQSVGKPFVAATVMGFLVIAVKSLIPVSVTQLILMITAGVVSYAIVILLIEPSIVMVIKNQIKPSKNV